MRGPLISIIPPFSIYLSDESLSQEFADCFPNLVSCKSGEKVLIDPDKVYIVAKGKLELQTTLPSNVPAKVESSAYLCKKHPGDIICKPNEQERAMEKVRCT